MEKLPNSKEQFLARQWEMLTGFVRKHTFKAVGAASLMFAAGGCTAEEFSRVTGELRASAAEGLVAYDARTAEVQRQAEYNRLYQQDRINYQRTFRVNAGVSNKGNFYNVENTERDNIKRDKDND